MSLQEGFKKIQGAMAVLGVSTALTVAPAQAETAKTPEKVHAASESCEVAAIWHGDNVYRRGIDLSIVSSEKLDKRNVEAAIFDGKPDDGSDVSICGIFNIKEFPHRLGQDAVREVYTDQGIINEYLATGQMSQGLMNRFENQYPGITEKIQAARAKVVASTTDFGAEEEATLIASNKTVPQP